MESEDLDVLAYVREVLARHAESLAQKPPAEASRGKAAKR
jgi:hypothetical protein